MRITKILSGLLPAVLIIWAASPNAQEYTLEDLGTLPDAFIMAGRGINETGDMTGYAYYTGGYHAFLYTDNNGLQDLGTPSGHHLSDGWDINSSMVIAGTGDNFPYYYSVADGWVNMGSFGGIEGAAYAVNDSGQITGFSYTDGSSNPHAFIYDIRDDSPHLIDITPDFNYAYGRDINNHGQITGYMVTSGYRAFRWHDGQLEDLGTIPNMAHSFGFAINEAGQVAAYASSATGNSSTIIRYTDGVGWEVLGGVGEHNTPYGMNNLGDVVGRGNANKGYEHAFLYTDDGGFRDLNDLADAPGYFLSWAFDINDSGEIVAVGSDNFGDSHLLRLLPVVTAVDEQANSLPREVSLGQNFPNPFNASTSISYELSKDAHVRLEVYNILGEKVALLVDKNETAGVHSVTWDAPGFASGYYFYNLGAGDFSDTKRMLLLK